MLTILLLVPSLRANSQAAPEPILVDEYFYIAACDDLLARLDGYFYELSLHPDQMGVIVLRNTPDRRTWNVTLQATIESWMDFREFDRRRVQFVRADGSHLRQFWRIPSGAPKPKIGNAIAGFQMSESVKKPFLLAEETRIGDQICPEIDRFAIFAAFLKANPSSRGNIVVRDRSPSVARRKGARVARKLEKIHGIQRKRVRTFIARFERPSNHDEAIVEYWYLP